MNGKICLVTGATNGIGRVAAAELARAGATVVIVGRNPEKTRAVAGQIMQETGAKVDLLLADLSVQAEVRQLADAFQQRYDRLHVLINNAGALFMRRETSQDGFEMTFALNHLAYFLLTHLLQDVLKASAPARIVNVASMAHFGGRLDLPGMANPRSYSSWKAYSQSKLANVVFTYELARRLEGSGVTANVLHPGFVATNFGVSNGGIFKPFFRLFQVMAISPEQGAQTILHLASSPEVEGVSGQYFDNCRLVRSSPVSYDRETARKLWEASLQMTGLAG